MRDLLCRLFLACLLAASIPSLSAEQKNGVMITVSKRTIKATKTQALKATIKNVSFKDMPEGELQWVLLVKHTGDSTLRKYAGKEQISPLRTAQSVDIVLATPVSRNNTRKVDLDYQFIVTQTGKEMVRTQTMKNFDAVAQNVTLTDPNASEGENPFGVRLEDLE